MKASSKASAGLERLLLPVVELRVPALGRFIEAHERALGAVQLLPRRGLEPDDAHPVAFREPTKFIQDDPEASLKPFIFRRNVAKEKKIQIQKVGLSAISSPGLSMESGQTAQGPFWASSL